MERVGLKGFYDLLSEVTKVSAWILPTAGVTPLIAALAGINPPWPNKVGLTVCTSFVILIVLVGVFHFLRRTRKKSVSAALMIAAVMLVATSICYFIVNSLFVFSTPVTGDSFVKGYVCTKEAMDLFGSKCPWLDLDELKSAEYEATRLWTALSVATVKIGLLFSWFLMFASGAFFLGSFLAFQLASRPILPRNPASDKV